MSEMFFLAFRSILKRRRRSLLTILGVFIGMAAVVALVSLGQGLQSTINEQFEKVGADKILILPKESFGTGSGSSASNITVDDEDVVERVNGVLEVAGILRKAVKVQFNDVQRAEFLMSIPDDSRKADLALAFMTWEPEAGRLISWKDNEKVAIGYSAWKDAFGKDIPVGAKVLVDGFSLEVVGLMKRMGDPQGDSAVIMAEPIARDLIGDSEGYTLLVAKSAVGEDPEVVSERIERALRRSRDVKEGQEDFEVQTASALIENFNSVLNIIQVVFVGLAAISLIVGGVNIMNTMYMAVLERTREIGVMKAIGARNREIMVLFVLESGLLGLGGGIVGILAGFGIAKGVELAVNATYGAGTLAAVLPAWLFIGVALFSFTAGAASGVAPAYRASRLQPVEALREE